MAYLLVEGSELRYGKCLYRLDVFDVPKFTLTLITSCCILFDKKLKPCSTLRAERGQHWTEPQTTPYI